MSLLILRGILPITFWFMLAYGCVTYCFRVPLFTGPLPYVEGVLSAQITMWDNFNSNCNILIFLKILISIFNKFYNVGALHKHTSTSHSQCVNIG
jgi:hypothetical protein